MKKLFTMLLCLIVGIGSMNAKDIASGTFKNGGSWKISEQGVLTVSATTVPNYINNNDDGKGFAALNSFGYNRHRLLGKEGSNAPWFAYKELITMIVLKSDVKTIGAYAFAGLGSVKKVIIESGTGTIAIGDYAFASCVNMTSFDFLV